ncbi:MAG: ABC transporter permease [Pseudomonadales bacterium]|jgi:putative ABC transport system permease protein|nr:ABC transporter permease [Pseudomonadales bacterium]
MRVPDLLRFTLLALRRQRFRSLMQLLAVAIGVASVVVLVALGEGARRYVLGEFSFIGKDTVVLFPGRKSTTGGMPPVTGVAARDITLADMLTIQRTVAGIESIAPLVVGNAPVSHGSLERDSTVIGTNADFFAVRQLRIAQGSMLPALALDIGTPVAVIGQKLKQELFGNRRAIGQWVRLRDYRFRVIGVLEGRGDSFGTDLSEAIFIPVASAQAVFNTNGLFRVVLKAREGVAIAPLKEELLERMKQLHEGEEDVTVTSPDAMISTFDGVLRALTLGVSGIAAISLVVAGILVMNLTLMSVSQRTPEIGLLKALGATDRQVRAIFLAEAGLLASAGALAGLLTGRAAIAGLAALYPAVPFSPPIWALASASVLAVATALLFAWLPAGKAARLEPVLALGRR